MIERIIFMQYGNQWLIHQFDITKTYFVVKNKVVKNKRTYTSFNRCTYDEVLYKSRTVLPAFFFRRSLKDASKYQILTTSNTITFIPKYYDTSNIFIMPDLYSNAKKSFFRNLSNIVYINVQDNLLQTFRQILNDSEVNINRLYEFMCSMATTVPIQEEDFVWPHFKFNVNFQIKQHQMKSKNFLIQQKIL